MSCQDFPRQYEQKHRAQRIELLEEDNRDLREREKNLKRISEEFARLLESLQTEADLLRSKLSDSQKQSREYLQLTDCLQDQNRQLRHRVQELTESRMSLSKDSQTDILKAELQKGKLRQEIYALRQEIDSTRLREVSNENLKEREHGIRMKEMELTMIAGTFERRLKEEQQFHRDTMKKYEMQIERLERRADELQEKKMQKENMLGDAYSKLKQLELENTGLTKKMSAIEMTLQQEKDKVRNKFSQELESMRKENQQLKQQLKAKQLQNRFNQQQTKKILLNQKTKNNILHESVSRVKTSYQQKSSLIIRQLLTKEEQISTLKRQLSRSRSKNNTGPLRQTPPMNSQKTLRLNSQTGLQHDKYSTVHSSLISETHRETMKTNKEMFKSRENRQIEVTVEKNLQHRQK